MSLLPFGQKREEEDSIQVVSKVDKIKDLAPRNKRNRKEIKKPWGKFERGLVFVVFFLTFVTSGVLGLYSRNWKLPNLPRLSIPASGIGSQTIVLEKDDRTQQKSDLVKSRFVEATNKLSGVYGFYVYRLYDDTGYGIYERETFQAASLIKLPVLYALYHEAEEGNLDLDEVYTLKDTDKIPGSGDLYYQPSGTKVTYREMAQAMGHSSDNTAYGIVVSTIGEDKIQELAFSIGMQNTKFETNETTPYEIGMFFRKLWSGNLLSERHSQEILKYLTDTIYEDRIPAGIPEDVRVAHKVGTEVNVVADAGIVYADRPFVLVIMSKGVVDKEAKDVFPELARIVWEVEAGD